MGAKTERVTIRLPQRFLEALDLLVSLDDFPSRSEAIRTAVRDLVYARASLVTKKTRRLRELHSNVSRLRELESQLLKR